MIIPFLNGILRFRTCPITWGLVFVNFAIMMFTLNDATTTQKALDDTLKDEYFISSQGRIYAQYIDDHKSQYSPMMREISSLALNGEKEKVELLGNLALRNSRFIKYGLDYEYVGDKVAEEWWKKKFKIVRSIQKMQPSHILGISSDRINLPNWLTYQFIHSGVVHFLFNMIFLLIFGCMLEPLIGSLGLLVTYLGSGMVAAGTFLLVTGASSAPLIGASGSVSGLMAFCCLLFWNKPIRCFYWLFIPIKGYAGFIFVPAWVIFLLWAMSDISGHLSTMAEFGGVAYTAHLGGEIAGLIVGISFLILRKLMNKGYLPEGWKSVPAGTRWPE